MSSVNSCCTIILEYLVVRDVNIISAKLRCLHPTFSLVTLVRGVGGKLSRLVYLAPPPTQDLGQAVSSVFLLLHNLGIFSCMRYKYYFRQTEMFASNVQFGYPCRRGGGQAVQAGLSCPRPEFQVVSLVNSYFTIFMEYLVVRDINIISVKLRCLHPTFSLITLVRGVGGKLSRLVYLAPHLLHHNLGIFSCMRYKHYLGQTEMFASNAQFGYPCPRGGGKLSRLVYLAPLPRIWVKQCHQLILIAPSSWNI